jgi:glycosyltransferase involved in cell wall biosynthesis
VNFEPPATLSPREVAADPAPAVTVILPTYQRRELVKRAVASVLAQTYRDFELIVIDDGSTDGTREALSPVADQLTYRWQPNQGVAAARNAGLRLGRGEIIAFLDSDDRWLPDHLAVVTEMLARHPEAVLATTAPRKVMAGTARPEDASLFDPLPTQFFANAFGYPSCVAVRSTTVMVTGGFDERLLVHEDHELFMRLAVQGPFSGLERRTVVRRYAPGLQDWGRRRGLYLDAFEFKARSAIEGARRTHSERTGTLVGWAQGALHFSLALRAIHRLDEDRAQAALTQACRSLPDLSHYPEQIEDRLRYLPDAHVPAQRLSHLIMTARAWPDPHADTALFLRFCALLAALRMGRLHTAGTLVTDLLLGPTRGSVVRSLAILRRRARRDFDAWRYRAVEQFEQGWRRFLATGG